MSGNDYLIAWCVYGVAALGCLLVWFRLTGWLWRWLREPLRLLMAVLLFTPSIVDASRDLYAPAIAITVLDVAFKVGNNVWSSVADLAMFSMIAFGLYLLLAAIRWPIERSLRARRARRQQTQPEDDRTLAERLQDDEALDASSRRPPRDDHRLRVEPRL